jgi:hypothetical protein
MRRFDEDAPQRLMIEIIVTNPDGSEETARATREDGVDATLEEGVAIAKERARAEGLNHVWFVDRTEGKREQEILAHGGDHTVGIEALDDDDLEEGEHGPDMRDLRPG